MQEWLDVEIVSGGIIFVQDIDDIRAYRFRSGRVSAGHGSVHLSWADPV